MKQMLKGGVIPTGKTSDFLGALRLADENKTKVASWPQLDAAMMDEPSRVELRKTALRHVSSSIGSYLGKGRAFKKGQDVKDHYGYDKERELILDGGSIPEEAEGVKSAYLHFNQIDISQVEEKKNKVILYPQGAQVFSPFPEKNGYSRIFASLTDGEERYIWRYDDIKADFVGPMVRDVFDVRGRLDVYLDVWPGGYRFGVPLDGSREAAAPKVNASATGDITAQIRELKTVFSETQQKLSEAQTVFSNAQRKLEELEKRIQA